MNGRFLLDTNIIIALFAQDASVLQNLSVAAEVPVPCVVLGELYYGAQKSTRVLENIARLDAFAAGPSFPATRKPRGTTVR
jgi:tRNA(fMet)-specific endonuclease VapC